MKPTEITEKELSDKVLKRLSSYFLIEKEVRGTHFSGTEKRVDAVIRPKDNTLWKNPNIAFGIEFKRPSIEHDIRKVTSLIHQAYEYQYTTFAGYGKIPILICPLKLHPSLETPTYSLIRRLLGQFGIGEIVNTNNVLKIMFHESHTIWSERDGVSYGKHWSFL